MGQTLGQRLEQRMSQSQIQSLDVLAMPVVELRERIAEELAENPALELVRGTQQTSLPQKGQAKLLERTVPYYRNNRTSSAFSAEASDAFQTFLENIPAPQHQSLQPAYPHLVYGHSLPQIRYHLSHE